MVTNGSEAFQYFGMNINLCKTSDHLLHCNSQAPKLIPVGQYTLLLMYWTTAHLLPIGI